MSDDLPKPRRARPRRAPIERSPDTRDAVHDDAVDDDAADEAVDAVAPSPPARRRGPALLHRIQLDPATGIGLFVPGLFVMALGGAATWHWIFNIGSGIMMLGMVYFVAAVALTALQQRWGGGAGNAQSPAASAG